MDAIGGGVLVAIAAALWIAYLLPSWLRQRQYVATERNAVRLQQTLRILAETAETPEEVRVEATARQVASQQRILAEQEAAARLEAEAAEQLAIAERIHAAEHAASARAIAERAVTEPISVVVPVPGQVVPEPVAVTVETEASEASVRVAPQPVSSASRRALRRRRAGCSMLVLASILTVVVGLVGLPFGLSPLVAGVGAAGAVAGLAGIVLLARRRSAPATVTVAAPAPVPEAFEPIDLPEAEPESVEGWTPNALPKALHLSRGTIAAAAMASIEEAEQLRRTAQEAQMAERAAELAPAVPKLEPRPAAPSPAPVAEPASPYAGMGVVGEATPGFDSLDAVLRRRRQAG
ncbi:hypothetical protein [Agromyces sp. LHK192]|uniref:hypothetical protein n=1 Tax=Agromyces sp. LHK192 TaxID=2498704 RepID=UPI000FDA4926|nr:hypothetical protein [Agromyces sp. LHK192]